MATLGLILMAFGALAFVYIAGTLRGRKLERRERIAQRLFTDRPIPD